MMILCLNELKPWRAYSGTVITMNEPCAPFDGVQG